MGIVRQYITQGQTQALAFLAVFSSGAAAFGPSIGGVLIHWGGWPSIFWVSFPLIVASLLLAVWILPSDRQNNLDNPDREPIRALIQKLDVWGIILFALAIIMSLLFLLSLADTVKWWPGLLAVGMGNANTDAIHPSAHVSPEQGLHVGTRSICNGQHDFFTLSSSACRRICKRYAISTRKTPVSSCCVSLDSA
jgi:MFS family permease